MEQLLPFVVVAIVFGGLFWYKRYTQQRWQQIAASLGFDYVKGGFFSRPSMTGTREGIACTVDVEVRGSGKSKSTYTRMTAHVPAGLPAGIAVSKEGVLSGIGKFFGAQDIEIGDTTFDGACMVKGDDIDGVIRLFQDPGARDAVWELVHAGWEGTLRGDRAVVLVHGFSTNENVIAMHLDQVVRAAKALAAATGQPVQELGELDPETFEATLEILPDEVELAGEEEVDLLEPAAEEPPPEDPVQKLADRMLGYEARREVLQLLAEPRTWTVEIFRKETTTALGLEPAYKEGETAIGKQGEVEVALRYPGEAPAEGTAEVMGRLVDWDDFYRRAIVEVELPPG